MGKRKKDAFGGKSMDIDDPNYWNFALSDKQIRKNIKRYDRARKRTGW